MGTISSYTKVDFMRVKTCEVCFFFSEVFHSV